MLSVRVAALAFAMLIPASAEDWWAWQNRDAVAIAKAYGDDWYPNFKTWNQAKLEGLFAPTCVFGSPVAGERGEQEESLMNGLKSTGSVYSSKEFRDSLTGFTVMSAVVEDAGDWETSVTGYTHPIKVTTLVKIETGKTAFYQWMVLVPFEGAANGWTCVMVLSAPAPGSIKSELVEMPANPLPANEALPGSLALVATFASGVFLTGCLFGRKELYARFMAPKQTPLL